MLRIPRSLAMVLSAALIGTIGAAAHGAETDKLALPGSTLEFTKFYAGPLGRQGQFPGKLLCLCCDLMPDNGSPKPCDANGHHHVLLLEDGLHPLIAGTPEVTKQINSNELHDKQVVVSGNYYPTTGYIFVDKIQLQ